MKSNYHPAWLIILMVFLNPSITGKASEAVTNQKTELLTSKQLVIAVLQTNPQLNVARAAWEVSHARIDQQATFEDPVFNYHLAPQTIGSHHTNYGQRIELSQKLPWLNKLHLRKAVASQTAEAVKQTIKSLRLKLSATAQSFFADWYYIHQAIHINQLNQALLKEFRTIAVNRYSTGLTRKQDALRAEMEFTLLEHQAIELAHTQRSIRTQINTLMNKPPAHILARPAPLSEIKPLPGIELLQTQALQARPELDAFAAMIEAAQLHFKLALKNNYPDFSLKASYNNLWQDSRKHFMIGIGVNLPLFQKQHRAAEQEARAQIKQTEWQRIDFIAKLGEDIQLSYDQTDESIHMLHLYKNKLLPLSRKILDTAKSDYQAGKGDFLNLIQCEKEYMQTRLKTEQALANTHRHLAKLKHAVGYSEPVLRSK